MRLLIVKLSSLGDIVSAMVSLQFIKNQYPDAQIDWLVDKRFEEALSNSPDIHQVHTVSLKESGQSLFKKLSCVSQKMKSLKKYDLIIDMQGLIKSAIIARAAGKNVIGFDRKSAKEGICALLYSKKVSVSFCAHILKRNFALLEEGLNIHTSFEKIMQKKSYLYYRAPTTDFEPYISSEKHNILVVLGGSWASKIYPKELIKEVIHRLNQNCLLLYSSDEEKERANWIKSQTPHCQILPKMSLNDVKALVDRVDIILGNDTGPTHMAWALNKPSVTILGCTSITRIAQTDINLVVTSKSCVNPCKIDKDDLSIAEIAPYEVVDAVQKLYFASSIQPPPNTTSS